MIGVIGVTELQGPGPSRCLPRIREGRTERLAHAYTA